jgi:tetratricopeptide (TPR) repeat protein
MWKRDVVSTIGWTEKWTGQDASLLKTDGTIVLIAAEENIKFFFRRDRTCIQHNTPEEFPPNLLKRPTLCDKDYMDRITTLTQILAQDPNNVLARYGLAMEYANSGQADRALEEFGKLVSANPDYAAGYFMAAQTLVKANRADEAKKMLVDGIAAAERKRDSHAQSEMQEMLDDLS